MFMSETRGCQPDQPASAGTYNDGFNCAPAAFIVIHEHCLIK